ncbi:phosphatase PAP2 family protein [Bergeyella sp. RCAD1439]|uniref:phosphatase PAP2 family protein n=1 Tax=Bergeyella anatis TaxID=3113737 RepID=UPI002E185037|nr:phosphatase PAP2 family protein [Bergeyella sp. RCAD1439]
MNTNVVDNFKALRVRALIWPVLLLMVLVAFLAFHGALDREGYIGIQKEMFISLNEILSKTPRLQYNLTQLGDAMIMLSFLAILVVYTPKVWEALVSGSLISLLLCNLPKTFFAVPRPAAVLDHDAFVIVGKVLAGHNSLPSGHAVTIFTSLTVLGVAFWPKSFGAKFFWSFFVLAVGVVLGLTRVGVGAHYPMDVLFGGILGYVSGVLGVFVAAKSRLWYWMGERRFYPVFLVAFLACAVVLIGKIMKEPLAVYYVAMFSLLVSSTVMLVKYVRK